MNKQFKSLVTLFTLASVFVFSSVLAGETPETATKGKKDKVSEAIVEYSMEFTSDDPNVKQQLFMMKGSSMTMAFKGQKLYSQTKVGSVQNSVTILDKDADKMVILMSGMMGKKAAEKTDLKDEEEENEEESDDKPDFKKTDETKEILGYECVKYISEDESGNKSVFWVTEEIKPEVKAKNFKNQGFDGFPLEFEIIQPQMNIKFTATNLETEISKKDEKKYFDLTIPEDYEVVTFEELQKMGGGQ